MTSLPFQSPGQTSAQQSAALPSSALDGFLSNTLTSAAAASRLASSVTNSKDVDIALCHVWSLIFSAAALTTDHHHLLIDLLRTICVLPSANLDNSHSTPEDHAKSESHVTSKDSSQLIWASLPNFGSQWRDTHDMLYAWRGGGLSGEKERLVNDPAAVPLGVQYVNFSAFSAKLLARFPNHIDIVWGFLACRDALEMKRESWDKTSGAGKARRELLSPAEVFAVDVSAAAQWILHTGTLLFAVKNSDISDYWAKALEKQTDYWEGAPGFSHERWKLWHQRFLELEKQEDMGKEVKTLAKMAVAEIERSTKEI
jgi:Protein of unknown function (DUF3632)